MGLIDFSLSDVGDIFVKAREAITGKKITDPVEIAKLDLQLEQLQNALLEGQIRINEKEAQNPNVFVSGARPFILWICGFAIAYYFIVAPFAVAFFHVTMPDINIDALFNLVIALLGLSGLRTYEKLRGVNDRHG